MSLDELDLTHVFSLSGSIIPAVLDHNAEEKLLPMVELLLLFNLEEHELSYFRVLTGSITSIMNIESTADESGFSNVVFVADTEFYSSGNLSYMEGKKIHYVIPLKRNSSLIP